MIINIYKNNEENKFVSKNKIYREGGVDVAGYTDTETKAVCNKNHITYNKNKKKNMKALKTNKGK